eukprot:3793-Heterococcus_DN1.PRE.1
MQQAARKVERRRSVGTPAEACRGDFCNFDLSRKLRLYENGEAAADATNTLQYGVPLSPFRRRLLIDAGIGTPADIAAVRGEWEHSCVALDSSIIKDSMLRNRSGVVRSSHSEDCYGLAKVVLTVYNHAVCTAASEAELGLPNAESAGSGLFAHKSHTKRQHQQQQQQQQQ